MKHYHNPPAGQPADAQLIEPQSAPHDNKAPNPGEALSVADAAQAAGMLDADAVGRISAMLTLEMDGVWPALTDALKDADGGNKALAAIAPLFEPGDVIELRALDLAAGGAVSLCGRLDVPDERVALEGFIDTWNGRSNLYFGANPRSIQLAGIAAAAHSGQIKARRSIFLDLDDKDAPANDPGWKRTLDALRSMAYLPEMIVRTGNGWHVWWRVQELTGAALTASVPLLQDLMARFGSDNVADLPRIARLPLTVNLPPPNKRARGAMPAFAKFEHIRNVGGEAGGGADAGPAQLTLDETVAQLNALAELLALPGKERLGKSGARSAVDAGGTRAPRSAPSLALLQMALSELPNEPGGPFDHRDEWVNVGHAAKGAVQGTPFEAESGEAFLAWSARNGGDPDKAEQFWGTIRNPHTGWGTLMRILEKVNPGGYARVLEAERQVMSEAARAALLTAPIEAAQFPVLLGDAGSGGRARGALRIMPRPAQVKASTTIPPRQWLYGNTYIRGYFSLTVAPGGLGKSSLVLTEALAMATGKALLPGLKPPPCPQRVWMLNLEDPQDELDRRLAAACAHFGLTGADLAGRLMMNSGRDMLLRLVEVAGGGAATVNERVVKELIEAMRREKIDVLILDPLASLHGAPENDNTSMNLVAAVLRRVADEAQASVMVVHHTTKAAALASGEQGIYGARGAGAIIDAARVARFLVRMTGKEAPRFGVSEESRRSLFRVENGKANLGPPENAQWRQIVSVALKNGTQDYPQGDHVGVVEAWEVPAAGAVTDAQIAAIQAAMAQAPADERRADPQSPGWAGYLIARVLGVGIGEPGVKKDDLDPHCAIEREWVRGLIKTGVEEGWLVRNQEGCSERQKRPCIRVGKPVEPSEEPATALAEESA